MFAITFKIPASGGTTIATIDELIEKIAQSIQSWPKLRIDKDYTSVILYSFEDLDSQTIFDIGYRVGTIMEVHRAQAQTSSTKSS